MCWCDSAVKSCVRWSQSSSMAFFREYCYLQVTSTTENLVNTDEEVNLWLCQHVTGFNDQLLGPLVDILEHHVQNNHCYSIIMLIMSTSMSIMNLYRCRIMKHVDNLHSTDMLQLYVYSTLTNILAYSILYPRLPITANTINIMKYLSRFSQHWSSDSARSQSNNFLSHQSQQLSFRVEHYC